MDTSPTFSFPSRADLERGCMPDGSPLRFPSRELDGERWPGPLPGKSTVTKTALKQEPPEGCGSIYTPPKGSLPYTGVPCPVPENREADYQAAVEKGMRGLEEWAINRMAANDRFQAMVIELGTRGAQVLLDHPELVREDLPDAPAPEPAKAARPEPVEGRERHTPTDEEICADAQAQSASLDQMMGLAREDAARVALASPPMPEELAAYAEPESGLKPESAKQDASDEPVPAPDATGPCNVPPEHRSNVQGQDGPATRSHSFRIPSKWRGGIYARCSALIALAARISPHRAKSIKAQLELGREMYARAAKTDLKNEFVNDRAHAAVSGWLLHLDMAFQDLGFGGWMPFRYANQWLTFVSLTRKLLAANGMITPKGPNHWRKFLEETPEVETEDDPLKLPKSLAPTKKYAAIESISEIIQRAQKKTELDVDFRKTFNQRFAMGP